MDNRFLWLIDNGHGARDLTRGKCSPSVKGMGIDDPTIYKDHFREGEFNRLVARALVKEALRAGLQAKLLVPEDADVSLSARVQRVNKYCQELGKSRVALISIHGNANSDGYWQPADYWTVWTSKGQTVSDKIADRLWLCCKEVMPDRKFGKQTAPDGDVDYESNFSILHKTACPAVLTENFFFDNRANIRFMASPAGRAKIVEGHLKGMLLCEKEL